jgi:hypothetical protein
VTLAVRNLEVEVSAAQLGSEECEINGCNVRTAQLSGTGR